MSAKISWWLVKNNSKRKCYQVWLDRILRKIADTLDKLLKGVIAVVKEQALNLCERFRSGLQVTQ